MNQIKQHVPAFVTGYEPEIVDFADLPDLLQIPFVKRYSDSPDFNGYAMNDGHLMAISMNGLEWRVVGYLKEWKEIRLPQWKAKFNPMRPIKNTGFRPLTYQEIVDEGIDAMCKDGFWYDVFLDATPVPTGVGLAYCIQVDPTKHTAEELQAMAYSKDCPTGIYHLAKTYQELFDEGWQYIDPASQHLTYCRKSV